MAPLSYLVSTVVLLSAANAHFNLNSPPSIGFVEDNEDQSPCGGFTPDFSKTPADFHVGGEPVATFLGHPQANWLYRATLDETASGNWTQLFPIVQQSGNGNFCETSVTADPSWVGKKGVFSVVCDTQDGVLYQVRSCFAPQSSSRLDSPRDLGPWTVPWLAQHTAWTPS